MSAERLALRGPTLISLVMLALALALVPLLAAPLSAQEEGPGPNPSDQEGQDTGEERWAADYFRGERKAFIHMTREQVRVDGQPLVKTVWSRVQSSGGDIWENHATTLEAEDGTVVRFEAMQNMMGDPTWTLGELRDEGIMICTKSRGAWTRGQSEGSEKAIGSYGLERLFREHIAPDSEPFEALVFEPGLGGGFQASIFKNQGKETIEIFGEETELTCFEMRHGLEGWKRNYWVDDRGRVVKEATAGGGSKLEKIWGPEEKVRPTKIVVSPKERRRMEAYRRKAVGALSLDGHEDFVRAIRFHPDGTRIASGSDDGTIRIWDVAKGKEIRSIDSGHGWVLSLSYDPDGELLASGGRDGTVKVWGRGSEEPLQTLEGHPWWVTSVAFHPGGGLLASAGDDPAIRLWDTTTWKSKSAWKGHEGWIDTIQFRPDGAWLASSGYDDKILLWDASDGSVVRTIPVVRGDPMMQKGDPPRVALHPEGSYLGATWGLYLGHARVINLGEDGGHRELETKVQGASCIAFAPDGKRLATGSGLGTVILWELDDEPLQRTLGSHGGGVLEIAFGPKGYRLATSSADRSVLIWDVGLPEGTADTGGDPGDVAGEEDSEIPGEKEDPEEVAGGEPRSQPKGPPVGPVDFSKWKARKFLGGEDWIKGVAFGGGGKLIATVVDEGVKIIDAREGWEKLHIGMRGYGVESITFGPDGKTLFLGGSEGRLRGEQSSVTLWDVERAREIRTLEGHVRPIASMVFSPDGKVLAAVGHDDVAKLWDWRVGKELGIVGIGGKGISSVTFRPDGKTIASGSLGQPIKLWDVATGKEIREFVDTSDGVTWVEFSPDGETLATVGPLKKARIYSVDTGEDSQRIREHTSNTHGADLSPDGRFLAAGGEDGTVMVWDTSTGEVLATWEAFGDFVRWLAWREDGRAIAAAHRRAGVKIWSAP